VNACPARRPDAHGAARAGDRDSTRARAAALV